VLFATSDWFARLLSNQQPRLAQNFLFHWIAPDLFNTIVDKGRMAAFCQAAGVRVPRTHAASPDDDIEAVTRSFVYPCIIKPVHRYSAGFPVETAKVLIANDARQALEFFEKYPQLRGGTLMQEMIEGGDDQVFQCTALVNNNGEVTACSTVRKLGQYPPGFGSMCYGQTERNDAVTAEALKLLRALGYRGLGSLEFKYRRKDGAYYFIEMNTRLPWYNGIFADAEVNLPYLAYLELTGEPPQSAARNTQRDYTRWLSARNYAGCYRESKGTRETGPAGFLSHLTRADSYAWWNWSDPAPFLGSLLLAARRGTGKLLRRLGLS
jgi:D-aspartate ligase